MDKGSEGLRDNVNSDAKLNARQRWRILAKAIKCRHPSIPHFGGFSLINIKQISLTDKFIGFPDNWNEYKITLGTGFCVNVHKMRRKITARDLMGFNNTGNVCLWPSEEALSHYVLENLLMFNNRWILELGGGMTCLAGLLVAKYGNPYGVHLTDGNSVSVDNVRKSLRLNDNINCYIKCSNLTWERCRDFFPTEENKFDFILSADCIFFDEARSSLADAIHYFLSANGTALVMAPSRGKTLDLFILEATSRELKCRIVRKYSDIVADYWKSNGRKFCDFCKCWIADNKPSIQFHENGRRHKANVEKRISDISKKAAKDEKSKKKMDFELRKMEEAAMAAYAQDISRNADMTSQNINRTLMETGVKPEEAAASTSAAVLAPTVRPRPVDPLLPPVDIQEMAFINAQRALHNQRQTDDDDSVTPKDPTLWCEARTPDGYTYYWNVKTNESVWEAPKEGYLTLDEYNRINAVASHQQEVQAAKECQIERENADEYVARIKRERLKQRRVQDGNESIKRKWDETEEYQAVDSYVSPGAGPYGKWETVVTAPTKNVDLQLPEVISTPTYIPPVLEHTTNFEPVRIFKEKVTKLDEATASSLPGVFKKRKIQQKNSRQRLDDD
ncbi:WW domain-binding protein 4 [Sergentomyia squamirostris]